MKSSEVLESNAVYFRKHCLNTYYVLETVLGIHKLSSESLLASGEQENRWRETGISSLMGMCGSVHICMCSVRSPKRVRGCACVFVQTHVLGVRRKMLCLHTENHCGRKKKIKRLGQLRSDESHGTSLLSTSSHSLEKAHQVTMPGHLKPTHFSLESKNP